MTRATLAVLAVLTILAAGALPAAAATGDNASGSDCEPLTPQEAKRLLGNLVDNVAAVVPGPLRGVWEVDAVKGGKIYPVYMDCARAFVFHGQFIRLSDMQNVTGQRFVDLNRVDVSAIPLKDAIVLGNRSSKNGIIVLTDPTCPYCVKLHAELKKVVAKDPKAAFYVMPYPRNAADKATYRKCLALVCARSAKLLDDAYSGKQLPAPSCNSNAVTETMQLAHRLQIQGTPSMILPDGRVVSGYMDAEAIRGLIR